MVLFQFRGFLKLISFLKKIELDFKIDLLRKKLKVLQKNE